MRLASVILDIPAQALDSAYWYVAPDDLVDLEVGCAVLVPFGGRKAIGYVIALEDFEETDEGAGFEAAAVRSCVGEAGKEGVPDPAKLKCVQAVLSHSYFDEDAAACARFLSEGYIAPLSSCVRLFVPPGGVPRMVRRGGYWQVEEPAIGPVDDRWVSLGAAAQGFEPRPQAVKQRAIIDALRGGELRVAELTVEFGPVSSALKALASQGVVTVERRRRMRGTDAPAAPAFAPSKKPQLTDGQKAALDLVNAAQDRAAGEVVLVDGVTGSGKTEVYLQAIEKTLDAGRGAVVLVPEISLTPQTVARFRGRFGETVAVMHSRMGPGERFDQWDRIRQGAARVVVGARSALFAPVGSLGLIIIDEEHEGSYKQDSAPRYVSRDLAAWMAAQKRATLVLGSATPSIEALYRCKHDEGWHRTLLPDRVNGRPMPEIVVVDMACEFGSGHRSMFSRPLAKALFEAVDAGRKAVLLLNQRGFAQFVLCRSCGYVPECPSCSLSLTYHERGSVLACHHCGHKEALPPLCPECESPYLKKFGAGTQRVEAELRGLLEGRQATIVRMDADTTTAKGAHQQLLEEFGSAGPAVLLGTQMIAKGLDFDDVVLVGVVNADTMLRLPDFRSAERTFNLVEQVAGRAGRAELPGCVFVQTYEADSYAIRAAAGYDRRAFLAEELSRRRALGYPPFVRLANVLLWGKNAEEVKEAARGISADIEKLVFDVAGQGWACFGAVPCVLAKLRDTYRWHIVVKAPAGADIASVLLPLFRRRKPHKTVSVAVDIDPDDLL
ncbi:MAG: primosomal protein N' [Eggerthellaceae bacterium]|nr:primosomal protein N' [Eggerthellaceae bacterium]